MGRGRAKAKQTKVARQLKYESPSMDLDRLRHELNGDHESPTGARPVDDIDEDDGDEDEEDWRAVR